MHEDVGSDAKVPKINGMTMKSRRMNAKVGMERRGEQRDRNSRATERRVDNNVPSVGCTPRLQLQSRVCEASRVH